MISDAICRFWHSYSPNGVAALPCLLYYRVFTFQPLGACGYNTSQWHSGSTDITMAAKTPLFRRKFPLLVTSSLLAIQTFSASAASEQFACQVSASGQWDCSAAAPSQPLPT